MNANGWPPRPDTPRGVEAVRARGPYGEAIWRYKVRWTDALRRPDGTKPRRAQTLDTVEEAVAFRARIGRARARGAMAEITGGDTTIREFVEHEWWPHASRELERSTLVGYASVYNNHVKPYVGDLKLRQLTSPLVVRLRGRLFDAGARKPTVRRALVVLQSICTYAIEVGHIKLNPVRDVTKPPVTRQLAIKLPSPAQVEQLLAELDPDSALLVELLAYEGLRPQEALALERRHRGRATLLVEQKWIGGPVVPGQKTGRRRLRSHRSPTLYAPVATSIDEHLKRHRRAAAGALLFQGERGGPWTAYEYAKWRRTVFKPAVKRAGLQITRPYDLRHACASLMLQAGVPLREIAEHMGHSVSTLSTYYSHLIADLRDQESVDVEQQIAAARLRPASGHTAGQGGPMRQSP